MSTTKKDIYQSVTDRIIKALEEGCAPWVKPWTESGTGMPVNAISGRVYHGVNVLLLWMAEQAGGYSSSRWLTYRQAAAAGGQVLRGEKGTEVVFFKPMAVPHPDRDGRPVYNENGEERMRVVPLLRSFTVFNIEQCDGLAEGLIDAPVMPVFDPVDRIEALVQAAGAVVRHQGDRAYYLPVRDFIGMPPRLAFQSRDGYYATLTHELVHWTGAPHRLDRQFGTDFGSPEYAFEELVAEIGAAFMCAEMGICGDLRHEGYIASWLEVLRNDKRAIFKAARLAKQASEFLLEFEGRNLQVAA